MEWEAKAPADGETIDQLELMGDVLLITWA
jgi:hypothetical protein